MIATVENPVFYQMRSNLSETEKTRLIEGHIDLVRSIAWKHANNRDAFELMEADGFLGLVKAAESFDPSMGNEFTTLAFRTIRGYILNGLRDRRRVAERNFTDVMAADEDGHSSEDAFGALADDRSMESEGNGFDTELLSVLVSILNETEYKVIVGRFIEGKTCREIGDELGFVRAWISKCEHSALEKIRDNDTACMLLSDAITMKAGGRN